jgi:ZIP family zinc transporter
VAEAFFWGALAAASLLVGAVLADAFQISSRLLGIVMGFGSGVLLSSTAFELVEESAIAAEGSGATVIGLFTGSLAFFAGDVAIGRAQRKRSGPPALAREAAHATAEQPPTALPLVLGIVLDGIPESAVVGLTLIGTGDVGVSMLVAVFISNVPESIAASTELWAGGWAHRRVYLLWAGVTVVCGLASALGFGLLDGASGSAVAFVLAFAGGAILCMLTTAMIPESYERAGRLVGLMATLGFATAFFLNWASN